MNFDVGAHFTLVDVQLWETKLERGVEYVPVIHDGHIGIQTRMGVAPQRLEYVDPEGESHSALRAIVHLGLRGFSTLQDSEGGDSIEERLLFELETSFAVVYSIQKEPDPQDLVLFVKCNCVHNAWPFWRQHVFDTLKRASLPLVPIPFFQIGRSEEVAILDEDFE